MKAFPVHRRNARHHRCDGELVSVQHSTAYVLTSAAASTETSAAASFIVSASTV